MTAKKNGASPDKRRKYDEAFKAEALRLTLVVRRPPAGLVVHSDQGSQYTATRFRDLLARHGAVQSMSRRGNCYDNAHAESFWSRFKAELLDGGNFSGLEEARLELSHHTSPITTPNVVIPPLATKPPTTSKLTSKQRPNSVRLS